MIFKMDIDKSEIMIDLEKNEADGRLTFLIPKEPQTGVNIFFFFHFLHWFRVKFLR